MEDKLIRQVQISHAYINALNAVVRGKRALIQAFEALEFHHYLLEQNEECDRQVQFVQRLQLLLWDGYTLPIDENDPEEVQDLLEFLDIFETNKWELHERACEIEAHLAALELGDSLSSAAYLAAGLIAQVKSRECYLGGLVEFCEIMGDPIRADAWREQLNRAEHRSRPIYRMFEMIRRFEDLDHTFFHELHDEALLLPGILRTQVHDMNQIHGLFQGELSFDIADFESFEARDWETHGFDPLMAGYWRAFGFQPLQAIEWLELEFDHPLEAASWSLRGFAPLSAERWKTAGYDERRASIFHSLGCKTPDDALELEKMSH